MYPYKMFGRLAMALSVGVLACQQPPVATEVNLQGTVVQVNDSYSNHPQIDSLIAPYKSKLEAQMNEVIGYGAKELTENKVEGALGNFIADLLLEAGYKYWGSKVDISLLTTGATRVPLPEGPITLGTIFELMPFENRLVLVKLTGEQTLDLFNYGAVNRNVAIGNSQFEISNNKAQSITIGGEPLDLNKTYYLATYDYLAWGGDEMEFMRETEIEDHIDILFRNTIIDKIKQLNAEGLKADAEVEGRVTVLN